MSLLRLTAGLLTLTLLVAFAAPAGADQVFSTVSTGPVHTYPTAAPYPLGDLYYSPCGWYGSSGGSGHSRGGHGRGTGSTTLTGERFYPYDIASNSNRIGGQRNGRRNGRGNCWSPAPHVSPHS